MSCIVSFIKFPTKKTGCKKGSNIPTMSAAAVRIHSLLQLQTVELYLWMLVVTKSLQQNSAQLQLVQNSSLVYIVNGFFGENEISGKWQFF